MYQEFHLDEPWDSEHNKALIAKMPKVYAAPGSKVANEFKTVYLVPHSHSGDRQTETIFPDGKKTRITTSPTAPRRHDLGGGSERRSGRDLDEAGRL